MLRCVRPEPRRQASSSSRDREGRSLPPETVVLPGSEVPPLAGSRLIGAAPPQQPLSATLVVRRKAALPPVNAAQGAAGQPPGPARLPMTRAELAARYGADAADLAKVEAFARQHGLQVTGADTARCSVTLTGTAQAFGSAFGVDFQLFEHPGGTYRGYSGPIHLPADLGGVVEAVLGLDDRPAARPR
jgi:kumamolisin